MTRNSESSDPTAAHNNLNSNSIPTTTSKLLPSIPSSYELDHAQPITTVLAPGTPLVILPNSRGIQLGSITLRPPASASPAGPSPSLAYPSGSVVLKDGTKLQYHNGSALVVNGTYTVTLPSQTAAGTTQRNESATEGDYKAYGSSTGVKPYTGGTCRTIAGQTYGALLGSAVRLLLPFLGI